MSANERYRYNPLNSYNFTEFLPQPQSPSPKPNSNLHLDFKFFKVYYVCDKIHFTMVAVTSISCSGRTAKMRNTYENKTEAE